jgi:hypothetical protein
MEMKYLLLGVILVIPIAVIQWLCSGRKESEEEGKVYEKKD